MDAFLLSLLCCAAAEAGDRQQWHSARLAQRFAHKGAVSSGLVIAIAIVVALPAAGAALIIPTINGSARTLMIALALAFAGFGLLRSVTPYNGFDRWRLGAMGTSATSMATLGLSGRSAFLIFGIGCWAADPLPAAVGGACGLATAWIGALWMQQELLHGRAMVIVRRCTACLFLLISALATVSAFRLL